MTSLITSAILNDETPGADTLATRLAYSMAIVRFVNDLVDSLDVTLPVYHLAKMLGIPLYFVEIRHTATHDELPSLELLRQVGVRARTWLWDNYWAKIEEPFASAVFGTEIETEVKTLTREWRRLRRDSLTKEVRRNDISVYGQQYWNLVNLFVQHQAGDERDMIRVFLTANILVPTDGKSVTSRIKLYGPLLKVLAGNGFVDRLVEALIEHLVSLEGNLEIEASKLVYDTLDTWAEVLFSQSEWFQDPEFVLSIVLGQIHAMSLKHLRVFITSLVEANRFILPRRLAKVRAAAQVWEGATEDKTAIEQVITEVENSLRINQAELDDNTMTFWELDTEWDPSHFIGDCS
ncbi:hypothetical protein D0Z00_002696 [Geotrichum galactomycetum]|uniref:Uncharacterized protein n=1 Tax=Geotrichum galactomycetum TaxID=27317 RepID=A0ACB6V3H2_9ASCO|nr:hypothetical protein D0Z00_002696 [Geotrichum candidum]